MITQKKGAKVTETHPLPRKVFLGDKKHLQREGACLVTRRCQAFGAQSGEPWPSTTHLCNLMYCRTASKSWATVSTPQGHDNSLSRNPKEQQQGQGGEASGDARIRPTDNFHHPALRKSNLPPRNHPQPGPTLCGNFRPFLVEPPLQSFLGICPCFSLSMWPHVETIPPLQSFSWVLIKKRYHLTTINHPPPLQYFPMPGWTICLQRDRGKG